MLLGPRIVGPNVPRNLSKETHLLEAIITQN
jgi:hypothetical protein